MCRPKRGKSTQELKRRFRKDELAQIDHAEARSQGRLAELEAEARELIVPSGSARQELAVADRVLAERRELAITAARIAPAAYITKELGERPSDPAKRQAWDRGVAQIERYRQEHGVRDQNKAFGREGKRKRGAERARQEAARRRLQEAQRALGLGQHAARARQLGRGLGIGR